MMAETGCDGVVVGRGCLGKPWLFGDLAAVFEGKEPPPPPRLGEVMVVMAEHARLLREFTGSDHGVVEFRKHAGWYVTGYPVGGDMRRGSDSARCSTNSTTSSPNSTRRPSFRPEGSDCRGTQRPDRSTATLPDRYLDHLEDEERPRRPTSIIPAANRVAAVDPCVVVAASS